MIRPTLDLNTPLNSTGSTLFRLNLAYESDDSHRDFVNNKSFYVAPSIIWNAGPATRLRINTEFQRYRYLFDNGFPPEPELMSGPVSAYYGEPGFNDTTIRQGGATIELTHGFSPR
jgi:iron complex outermembrane receptor protein